MRIDEGDLVPDQVLRRTRKALDEAQVRRSAARAGLEVGGFDDERRTFPVAARVAHVHPNGRRHVLRLRRRIDRNDTRVVKMSSLGDRNDTRSLNDSKIRVVDRREHCVRKAAAVHDTAHAEPVVLVRVARLAALQTAAPLTVALPPEGLAAADAHPVDQLPGKCAASPFCIRANAESVRSAHRPCRQARRPAADRARRVAARQLAVSRIPPR